MKPRWIVAPLMSVAALMMLGLYAPVVASAAHYCKANEETCKEANVYPTGTVFKFATAAGSPALITLGPIGPAECNLAAEIKSTSASGEPLLGEVTALAWSNCTIFGNNCTIESLNLPYQASTTKQTSPLFSTEIRKLKSGDPQAKVVCGSIINCTYTSEAVALSGTGGAAGVANLTATKSPFSPLGTKCVKSTVTAKLILSTPASLFVTN